MKIHLSWMVVILCLVIVIADVALAVFNVIKPDSSDSVVIFDGLSSWFEKKIENSIDINGDKVSGLGIGYLIGDKTKLPAGLDSQIKTVGMSHIIVVSGTHLAIIVDVCRRFFGRISKRIGVYFSILILVVYIGIVGLTPSLVRSGLVSILTLIASLRGRKFEPWRIVLIVGAITLLYNPNYILSVSWQLSMAAYVGVLVISPIISKLFYDKGEKMGLIGSSIVSSVSALLMCLPISLYYFGSVSLLTFVANILILPTISIVMGLVLLAGILNGFLFNIFGILGNWLLKYHLFVISFLSQYTELVIDLNKNNPAVFMLYVPVLILIIVDVMLAKRRRRRRLEMIELYFPTKQNVEVGGKDAPG